MQNEWMGNNMESGHTQPVTDQKTTCITSKEMKRSGLKTLRKHYLFLILVCLASAILGSEFSDSLTPMKTVMFQPQALSEEGSSDDKEEDIFTGVINNLTATDVLSRCLRDGVEAGSGESKKLEERIIQSSTDPALGRTRGVFSAVLNYVASGSVWVSLLSATRNLIHSETMADVLVITGVIILYFLFLIFVRGFYRVLMQRTFLECRTYSFENYGRLLHFIHIRRWARASLTMLVETVLKSLWYLTIIGGIIKEFSYFLVPYITAENADIKPLEAITLSRRMMQGHKWDCFVKHLSFIGWWILGMLTFGISDILFFNAYISASFAEYYVQLRKLAIENKIDGWEMLNDRWLVDKAPQALLDEAYAKEKKELEENVIHAPKRSAFARLLADWAGVVLLRTPQEVEYEKEQRRHMSLLVSEKIIRGESYPVRLSPVPDKQKNKRVEGIYYDRNYTVTSICLLYLIFSFIGWLWEGALVTIETGSFVNRGALHGPWIPIYGAGCILVLIFLKKLRNKPILHFFATILLCGVVEYLTGLTLELLHDGKRWWDYSGYFLNLDGRVCAEGLLVFGVLGSVVVYVLAPLIDSTIRRIPLKIIVPITAVLMTIFLIDDINSMKHPNEGAGVTSIPESEHDRNDAVSDQLSAGDIAVIQTAVSEK